MNASEARKQTQQVLEERYESVIETALSNVQEAISKGHTQVSYDTMLDDEHKNFLYKEMQKLGYYVSITNTFRWLKIVSMKVTIDWSEEMTW